MEGERAYQGSADRADPHYPLIDINLKRRQKTAPVGLTGAVFHVGSFIPLGGKNRCRSVYRVFQALAGLELGLG